MGALVKHLEQPEQVRLSTLQMTQCEGLDDELPFVECIKVRQLLPDLSCHLYRHVYLCIIYEWLFVYIDVLA